MTGPADLGVYVHIPFCRRRCDYCAFATWTDRHHLRADYLDAVARDIDQAVGRGALGEATSVFFGGGTPSQVPAGDLMAVLARVPRRPGAEVTVECNPDDVTAEALETYQRGGVTRISLGVQSMQDQTLVSLGRVHQPDRVVAAVELIRRVGFVSFNLDLIYGAAGETLSSWEESLNRVLELEPPHVSAYALTVEPGTPLARQPARHPEPDRQADMYLLGAQRLEEAGLDWYEISNWARLGHACRHNQLYWSQGDYLGFGSAAHSHRDGSRWWNLRTPERYIAAVQAGATRRAGGEDLDAVQRAAEARQLALRTRQGVPAASLRDLDELVGLGLIEADSTRMVLTRTGRLLANEVAMRLVEEPAPTVPDSVSSPSVCL